MGGGGLCQRRRPRCLSGPRLLRAGSEGTAPRGSISCPWVPEIIVLVFFFFSPFHRESARSVRACSPSRGAEAVGRSGAERSAQLHARGSVRRSSERRAAPLPPASCRSLRCAQSPLCGGCAALQSRLEPSPDAGGSPHAPGLPADCRRCASGRALGARGAPGWVASLVGSALRAVGLAMLGLQREDP